MTSPFPRLGPRLETEPLAPVTALQPPVADFSSANGAPANSVQFTDLSVDVDGTIVDWLWDFGEGAPTARFAISRNGLVVQFQNQSTAVAPATLASYLWNFGDGTTSTAANPTKTYAGPGNYNASLVVTDSNALVSQAAQMVVNAISGTGRPYGPYGFFQGSVTPKPHTQFFNCSHDQPQPHDIEARLDWARRNQHKLILVLTGGKTALGTNGFDLTKWRARLQTFNTSGIRTAVANGVAGGWVLGFDMVDEPNHNKWNDWFTKPRIDELRDYSRTIFPTLPCGVVCEPHFRSFERYQRLDFNIYQFWQPCPGTVNCTSVEEFRDVSLAQAAADGVVPVFSYNVRDGGLRGGSNSLCPLGPTGGYGVVPPQGTPPKCRATPTQVRDYVQTLGAAPGVAAVLMWQYDLAMYQQSTTSWSPGLSYQDAFAQNRAFLDAQPARSLARP